MKIRTTDDAHRESKPIKMDGILYKLRTTSDRFLKKYFVFEIYIYISSIIRNILNRCDTSFNRTLVYKTV